MRKNGREAIAVFPQVKESEMGKRGPQKTPLKVLELRGTAGKRDRQQRVIPEIPSAVPECPDWLPEDAAEKWAELAPMLHGLAPVMPLHGLAPMPPAMPLHPASPGEVGVPPAAPPAPAPPARIV